MSSESIPHNRGVTMSQQPHSGKRSTGRAVLKGAIYTIAAVVICAILATLALVLLRHLGGVPELLQGIHTLRLYGYSIQMGLIVALWFRWAALIDWLVRRGSLPGAAREPLLARRNRWISVLVVFEVFLFFSTMPVSAG